MDSLADSSFEDSQTAMEVPVEGLNVRYREEDGSVLFESYIPPSRDAIHLPTYVLYLFIAISILLGVLYAIIGHLIKDLIHDFAGLVLLKPEDSLLKVLVSTINYHHLQCFFSCIPCCVPFIHISLLPSISVFQTGCLGSSLKK